MLAAMGYPVLGPEMLPHAAHPRHTHMGSRTMLGTRDVSITPFPVLNPMNTANYMPSVAGPASYSVQRPIPMYGVAFSDVSNIMNMANGTPVQQGRSKSPERPRAPVAPMPPGLPDTVEPNVAGQRDKNTSEDVEIKAEPTSDDEDEVASSSPKTKSKRSSNTSSNLKEESDDDDYMHAHGNDGVIDLNSCTDYGSRNRYLKSAEYGVDIDNSLNVAGDGSFLLGPQWQVPKSNTARLNAGPDFGQASAWVEQNQGDKSRGLGGDGQHGGGSHSYDNGDTQKVATADRTDGTNTQGFLATWLRTINLGGRNHQGHHSSAHTHSHNGHDSYVICRGPVPTNLTVSGARGPRPSH
ncbi:hypothetical protein F5Y07DRAFT_115615 [Xylaria sp. FL0933]|nr:hypothetical protein F5Y07DRAFT_115615 [Xylaria sp. FL0933]